MKYKNTTLIIITAILQTACGANMFASLPDSNSSLDDKITEARILIDQSKYDDAIEILDEIDEEGAVNFEANKLYGDALLGKSGISPVQILVNAAAAEEDPDSAGKSDLQRIADLLPSATDELLVNVDLAIEHYVSIQNLTTSIYLRLAFVNMIKAPLVLMNALDSTDLDNITPEQLAGLSILVLQTVYNAISSADEYNGLLDSGAQSDAISDIKTEIDAQPGETIGEKVSGYVITGAS